MFVIMGGTGHVGGAAARALLAAGEAVTVITRDAARAGEWTSCGAGVVEADVRDIPSLRAALARGRRALLLNPPADPAGDTDVAERTTVAAILDALDGSGLEKVVAVSTYGAQPGDRLGDLSVLWELEEGLRRQPIPAAINRGAYYLSNWDGMLGTARESGVLPTMLPADLALPMVAPNDVGLAAAQRLLSGADDVGVRFVEGPDRWSPADVAAAFTAALGRPVALEEVPRQQWRTTFERLGFSPEAADAYTRMTEVTVDGGFDMPDDPWRGGTTLADHVGSLLG